MPKTFIPRANIRTAGGHPDKTRPNSKMAARIPDNRPISAVQREIIRTAQNSPMAQMKFTEPEPVQEKTVQGLMDEEEPLQGKGIVQKIELEDEELAQSKPMAQREIDEDEIQAKFHSASLPVQKKDNRTGLPDHVKGRMESSFNTDFSDVKVHANSGKAPEVGALAYTQGSDIHFAPGQFSPESASGRQLLGHELAHVVQQRQGRVQPTTEVNGMPVNDSTSLEREADIQGRKV